MKLWRGGPERGPTTWAHHTSKGQGRSLATACITLPMSTSRIRSTDSDTRIGSFARRSFGMYATSRGHSFRQPEHRQPSTCMTGSPRQRFVPHSRLFLKPVCAMNCCALALQMMLWDSAHPRRSSSMCLMRLALLARSYRFPDLILLQDVRVHSQRPEDPGARTAEAAGHGFEIDALLLGSVRNCRPSA